MAVSAWHEISRCPICGGKVKVRNTSQVYDTLLKDGTVYRRRYYYFRFACAQQHYWIRGRNVYQSTEGLKGAIRGYNRWAANPSKAQEDWRRIQRLTRQTQQEYKRLKENNRVAERNARTNA